MEPRIRYAKTEDGVSIAYYALATDYADLLAKAGLPFRKAHEVVGRLVQYAEKQGKAFSELTPAEFQKFSKLFPENAPKLSVEDALRARSAVGGTSPRGVATQLRKWRTKLQR